jgi:phosphoglycolate phosphatase/pyrophosphatase PpaX
MEDTRNAHRKNIKAVLFDLDGVLIDSYHAWYRQFNDALKHFGHKPIPERVFRHHWGQSTEEDVRIFMSERTPDQVRRYFSRHFDDYVHYVRVNPLAHDTLKKLCAMRLKLGCVTNSHRSIVKKILKNAHLEKFFAVVVTADDVKNPKPSPDMIVHACQRLRVEPGETLFLGDTTTDVQAGKRAGCVVIGYNMKSVPAVKHLKQFVALIKTYRR